MKYLFNNLKTDFISLLLHFAVFRMGNGKSLKETSVFRLICAEIQEDPDTLMLALNRQELSVGSQSSPFQKLVETSNVELVR